MSSKPLPILPGATLGILGGGQLGRMFTIAARTMGYKVMVLDPDFASPAGQMADVHLQADYTDHGALRQLGAACAAVTTEFENVPAASLIELANHCRVSPGADGRRHRAGPQPRKILARRTTVSPPRRSRWSTARPTSTPRWPRPARRRC